MTTMTDTYTCPQNATVRRPAAIGIVAWILAAQAAYRSRRALESLDPAALADIGLSADEAKAEAKRPIWDVPATWLR